MTPLKTIRTTLVSVIFRQFGSYFFGLLILQDKHNIGTRYIVVEYEINLHSLRNRLENLAKGLLFYLFVKLVLINLIFSDNVHILYIYESYSHKENQYGKSHKYKQL